MSSQQRNIVQGLAGSKCPRCRQGNMFTQKSIFPLKTCLQMKEYCDTCGQKIKVENNYGQGMNFVFIFAIFIITLCIYWPVFGLSYKDNSVFIYITVATLLSLVLQPWLMRFSRVLFLYMVIGFDPKAAAQHQEPVAGNQEQPL
jgi:uncharacterized protein (DUF983 family)